MKEIATVETEPLNHGTPWISRAKRHVFSFIL